MPDKQEETKAVASGVFETVACPKKGYTFISLAACVICPEHIRLVPLGRSPKTDRRMHQIECRLPKARDINRYEHGRGVMEVANCPKWKAQLPLVECAECDWHKGVQERRRYWLLAFILRRPRVLERKVTCGLPVHRNTAFIITGVQEV